MNTIVFITGAPASGKSTIARRVAEHFPRSMHLQVDQLREMMVNGAEMPDHGWTDETTRQFQRARSTAAYMAQLYAEAGVNVVIDDVCVPENFPDYYTSLFENAIVHRVLLMPTSEALVARTEKRAGPFDKFLVDLIPWFYGYLEPMPKDGWIVLDSSDWTIEQTVTEVLNGIGATTDEFNNAPASNRD